MKWQSFGAALLGCLALAAIIAAAVAGPKSDADLLKLRGELRELREVVSATRVTLEHLKSGQDGVHDGLRDRAGEFEKQVDSRLLSQHATMVLLEDRLTALEDRCKCGRASGGANCRVLLFTGPKCELCGPFKEALAGYVAAKGLKVGFTPDANIQVIDVSQRPAVAERYKVTNLPTMVVIENDLPVQGARHVGTGTPESVYTWMQYYFDAAAKRAAAKP